MRSKMATRNDSCHRSQYVFGYISRRLINQVHRNVFNTASREEILDIVQKMWKSHSEAEMEMSIVVGILCDSWTNSAFWSNSQPVY